MDAGTAASGAALFLRLGTGAVFVAHGLQKLRPDGAGVKVGRRHLVESIARLGFPWPEAWAWAVTALQCLGGLLLILGVFTPVLAAALALVMAVAAYEKSPQGFVLAADFPFALLCALLALVLLGEGRFSMGGVLAR
ncbi:MAG TPA: DoxX family membrane protein [Candidatus Methylomirabilis sp.]